MSRRREKRRNRLDKKIQKTSKKHKKLSDKYNRETVIDKALKKETYIKFERGAVTDKSGTQKYKTTARLAVRDKKHTGHGVLNTAVRRLDKFEGDVPSLTKKLQSSQPKTRRGRAAKTVLLASAGTLKRTGKYALAAENAAVSTTYKVTKKAVTKAAGAAAGAVKNKLHNKAEESLGGYSFYLKAAGALPSAKEIKQYIKQKNIYHLETSKAKLLKAESKMNRLETKQAKKELRKAKSKFLEKTGTVSYLNGNMNNIRYSRPIEEKTEKLTSAKKELRSAQKELRQAKKSARELGKSADRATPMSAAGVQKNVPNSPKVSQSKADTIRSGGGKPLPEKSGKKRFEKTSQTVKDKPLLEKSEKMRLEKVSQTATDKPQFVKSGNARLDKASQAATDRAHFVKGGNARLDKASQAVKEKKAKVRELKFDRKALAKQKKTEARFSVLEKKAEYRSKLSASNGVLAGKKREYALQKRLAKYEKPQSMIGGKVKQLASSAKSKLINADPDNSTLQAAGKVIDVTSKASAAAVGTYKLLNKAEIRAEAKLRERARVSSQNRLQNSRQKLDRQRAANRKPQTYKNRPKAKEKVTKKVTEFFKNVAASAGGAGAKVLAVGLPIVLVVLAAAMIIYLLMNSIAGMYESGMIWTTGTYPADDFALGRAERAYTEIAKKMNYNIIDVGSKSKWKGTLVNKFGADISKLSSTPKYWYWGKSEKYDWDPEYDFDPHKLWSFLCAYYTEFTDEGKSKITHWEYSDDTAELLQKLFDEEYEFVYDYIDDGYWDELDDYVYYPSSENSYWLNDGCADRYAYGDYFDIDDEPGGKLSGFSDGESRLYFDPETLEILDIRKTGDSSESDLYGYDGYKRTGYFLVNQFFDDCNCDRYFYDDWDYGDYIHTYDDDSITVCHSNVNYPYLVSGEDIHWTNEDLTEDVWGWQYFQKAEWVEDTTLYYNIKQNKSFEEAIEDILSDMENGDERVELYEMYMGESDDAPDIHGGHQSYTNILPGDSFYDDYVAAGKIAAGFGYCMKEWGEYSHLYEEKNKKHNGIDILVDKDTEVYAAFDGKITQLNKDKGIIRLRTDSFKYFYESGESDEDVDGRDTEVIYYNVSAADTLAVGSTVKAGDLIGYINGNTMCDNGKDNSSYISDPYLHLEVYIDKDGFGWEYVDPIPLIP